MTQSLAPDPFGALVERFNLPALQTGPLSGMRFTVKDNEG
jgi:hypothetical protein